MIVIGASNAFVLTTGFTIPCNILIMLSAPKADVLGISISAG